MEFTPDRTGSQTYSIASLVSDGGVNVLVSEEGKSGSPSAPGRQVAQGGELNKKQAEILAKMSEAQQEDESGSDKDASGKDASGSAKLRLSQKAVERLGFETEEQLFRAKALDKMGLSEEDMYKAAPYFKTPEEQNKIRNSFKKLGYTDKLPKVTGMSEEQIMRRKAVEKLGTSENELEKDREETLGKLGTSARSHQGSDDSGHCLS